MCVYSSKLYRISGREIPVENYSKPKVSLVRSFVFAQSEFDLCIAIGCLTMFTKRGPILKQHSEKLRQLWHLWAPNNYPFQI